MSTSRSLVITTIAPATEVLRNYAEECRRHDIDFIIAGDRKSPPDFSLPGSDFWSIDRQLDSGYKSAQAIPVNHYARKNIAYLAAIEKGNEIILETDDDNLPYESFWNLPGTGVGGQLVRNRGWINVFSLFTDQVIWPRGFPLEQIGKEIIETGPGNNYHCPIQQGLADDNPDVDAVFRLTRDLPLRFEQDLSFVLGKGSWCPFNSQNTVWFKEAFPLLYLPSKCTFRMTDIWRSFVAQRIAWEYGWNIAFYSPTVYQERNEHNLLKDLEDEIPGYLNNSAIARALEDLKLSGNQDDIFRNLVLCYDKLIEMDLVGREETDILNQWIGDLQNLI